MWVFVLDVLQSYEVPINQMYSITIDNAANMEDDNNGNENVFSFIKSVSINMCFLDPRYQILLFSNDKIKAKIY